MSEYVKVFLRMLTMLAAMSIIFTLFYSINLFTKSKFFVNSEVLFSGIQNSNPKNINESISQFKNRNMMGRYEVGDSILNDPWIKMAYLKKLYPNKIKLVVQERGTIMKLSSQKRCYFYSIEGDLLTADCSDVKIFDYSSMDKDRLYITARILMNTKDLNYDRIDLYKSHISISLKGYRMLLPYDFEVFRKNVNYARAISTMYKSINYIDIRVPRKIYVNGVKNET
ncbi:MAG: FtsQ-type POTRA domain-containing protein [Calditerrivibrio sp.]|nr:FtsQ-type POTRA domain-containing protein [Calditerrivibrio sp.]